MAWSNSGHVSTSTRRRILARDSHTCQRCGATGVPLEINHIDNTRGPGYDRDENLEALCVPCHRVETLRETAEGHRARRARGRHPQEAHPGLKW